MYALIIYIACSVVINSVNNFLTKAIPALNREFRCTDTPLTRATILHWNELFS